VACWHCAVLGDLVRVLAFTHYAVEIGASCANNFRRDPLVIVYPMLSSCGEVAYTTWPQLHSHTFFAFKCCRACHGGEFPIIPCSKSSCTFRFVVALLVDFNPSATVSKLFAPFNRAVACLSCGLVNTRIGRWHLERHYVHSIIRARVKDG